MKRKGLKIELEITERQIKQLDNFFFQKRHISSTVFFFSPPPPKESVQSVCAPMRLLKSELELKKKKVFIMQAVAQHAMNSTATVNDSH